MSVINVTVTNAGAASVSVSNGSTVNATVGNGGAVNVSTGTISPGNATVVSGTLAINSVTTLAAGSQAYVKNDLGTAYAAKLDIGLPAGPATSVTVGKTTTLAAGSSATVTGTTDAGNLTLSFGIPAGASGSNGLNGTTPTITASATTLSAGSSATVTATPSDGGASVELAFGIPRGADGAAGSSVTLSDATPATLGTASAGTSTTASRSDHVHAVPVISYANLTNVPSTFAPSTHTHTASQVTDFTTAAAAAAPVQAVAGRTGDVVISTGDVVGLDALLAGVSVDVIDGGDYVGVVLSPSITITSQPANYAAALNVGLSWSSVGTGNTYWRGIAYNGSRWVIAGQWFASGSAYYTTTSTDATTWTLRGNSTSPQFPVNALASDGTSFVAVGNGQFAGSTDGLSWTGGTLPVNANAIAHGNSRWLAAGSSSSTSTNGTTWAAAVTAPATIQYLCYGSGGFVGVAAGTTASVYRTTDGTSWSTHSLPASASWSGVAFGGGVYVAVRTGSTAAYSSDGQTWSTATMPSSRVWGGVVYSGGRFFAFGYNSTAAAYSADGQTWTAITLPATGRWLAAAGGSSSVMAVNQGTGSHAYSVAASSATFAVAAASTATLSYQWQLSTDGGTTFANISGATSATLSLSGLTTADNGKRFQCIVSATGTSSVTSNAATLTVN